jgi:hypothetical protein
VIPTRAELEEANTRELEEIGNFRGTWGAAQPAAQTLKIEDPFKMVEEDLQKTKEFALNNIVNRNANISS